MSSLKSQHNIEDIKREIAAIFHEMKDPRIKTEFLNISKIKVSEKGTACHVFISSLNGIEEAKKAVKFLDGASGFFRTELGKRIRLRYVPQVFFQPTDAVEYGVKMIKKIDEITKSNNS